MEGSDAAEALGFGDDVQCHGGLAAGFRTVDFDDSAPGEPAYAEREVEERQPVGITLTGTSTSRLPRRMIEPLP